MAAFIGTLQSLLVNFRYLRPVWRKNQEEERLLGVSITGVQDHSVLRGQGGDFRFWGHGDEEEKEGNQTSDIDGKVLLWSTLVALREVTKSVNREVAGVLGIPEAKQVTLIKPSGTVSKLCSTSSGMHPRPAPFYIQRVTQDIKDPLTELMKAQGIPHTVDRGGDKVYFAFPIQSPEGALCSKDISALDQLELWKIYQEAWCDGNPSQTVYYTDKDFIQIQAWLWENWDIVGGLSFFPKDDHIYENAPWEPISEERYRQLAGEFPEIDWSRIVDFETDDCTTGSQEMACAGGACEM